MLFGIINRAHCIALSPNQRIISPCYPSGHTPLQLLRPCLVSPTVLYRLQTQFLLCSIFLSVPALPLRLLYLSTLSTSVFALHLTLQAACSAVRLRLPVCVIGEHSLMFLLLFIQLRSSELLRFAVKATVTLAVAVARA